MKVLGKDELITKFETFVVIKKELEYSKNIDKHLYHNFCLKRDDAFKDIYEKYFMKLISDKILYKSVQKYIVNTCPHLVPKELYNEDYNNSRELISNISDKIVNFIKEIDIYNFDSKEKIQIIDINCEKFVDLYVIMNYGEKKCEENKIEHILKLLRNLHITNLISIEQ
ncbi:DNA-directed RNA polymerase II subunit RPB4, putative [Plasmodium gallinaceum]|uniref:DNA-directed RNA polymerase II subunit RPB4, putative n=1 Tax=Plasmodium gallinaceum TaxID=5849 RepID=A0A1J1GTD5_PLAGA|nr:DNA-directed RNA polymerase II subunit RPB4, putative [Plasmodium gallinaceum]CRG95560.1 DNA-directed RNA polymerase II subunit RPB4, putative [Plasmodium gallinaceum]